MNTSRLIQEIIVDAIKSFVYGAPWSPESIVGHNILTKNGSDLNGWSRRHIAHNILNEKLFGRVIDRCIG